MVPMLLVDMIEAPINGSLSLPFTCPLIVKVPDVAFGSDI